MNLDVDFLNLLFKDPRTILETIHGLRVKSQQENLSFPARIVLNPNTLNDLTLFGCVVVWDSNAIEARLEWD